MIQVFPGNLHFYNVNLVIPDVRGKVILDVPCGNGYFGRKYFRQNAAKVIACDIIPFQIEDTLPLLYYALQDPTTL